MDNWLRTRPVWVLVPLFWLWAFGGSLVGVVVWQMVDTEPLSGISSFAGTAAIGSLCLAVGATWGTVRRRRREDPRRDR